MGAVQQALLALGGGGSGLDPLNLLQSRFVGGSASDESYHAGGAPTQSGGTVADGEFIVDRNHAADPSTPSVLQYETPALLWPGGQPVTVEFLSEWEATPNASYLRLFTVQTNVLDVATVHRFGYHGYEGRMVYDNAGFGVEHISAAPLLGLTHGALVFGATSLRAYLAGVLVWELAGDSRPAAAQGRLLVGDDTGYTSGVTQYRIKGFRVRLAEVYSGASFTPPSVIPLP